MAITRSLPEKQTRVFILGPRCVRMLQRSQKYSPQWIVTHNTVLSKITKRLKTGDVDMTVREILSTPYVLPLRPDRPDVETNLQKIVQEMATVVAEPSFVRHLPFVPDAIGSNIDILVSFLNKEIGRFVYTRVEYTTLKDVVFKFEATPLIVKR